MPLLSGKGRRDLKDEFPKWAAEEISGSKMLLQGRVEASGYLLDKDDKNNKVDVQFYDQLPDGRYIATLESPELQVKDLEFAVTYLFQIKVFKASLSKKLVDFLAERYEMQMDSVHKFELTRAEKVD